MPTEVESRYVIPDQSLFSRLRAVRHLGPFAARSQNTQKLTDHYLDTRGRALLRQGWACRLRSHDGEWTLTLKGPRSRDGAIVSRPEYEITLLERIQDFGRWPAGPIRERVRDLTGGIPLQTLVTIGQTRHKFVLASGSRPIGELSLDVVHTRSKDLRHRSYMLECELLPGGEVADLEQRGLPHVRAPHQRPRSGEELLHREGLDQVVVGAEVESPHAIVDLVPRGEDQDVRIVPSGAQLRQHLESVEPWQHQVEHDQVVLPGAGPVQAFPAVVALVHGEVVLT